MQGVGDQSGRDTGNGKRDTLCLTFPLSRFPFPDQVFGRCLDRLERAACVAIGFPRDERQGVVLDFETQAAEPPLLVSERAAHQRRDVLRVQRLEHEDAAARQQRARELEAWVGRRRADQRDDAVFHPGQERILLRLVEPMDLVAKEDRAAPFVPQPALRLVDDLADTGHSLRHG